MATGPEHYREAEKLLGYAAQILAEDWGCREEMSFLAEAQVRATLALAAAAALTGCTASYYDTDEPEIKAWHEVAGVKAEAANGGEGR